MTGSSSGAVRVVLAGVIVCLAAYAVVVGRNEVTPPTASMTAPVAPAAALGCGSVGPYRVPDLGGAGLPAGLDLCRSGPIRVTVPGSVLDGWDVHGGIVIDAPDVVLLRSRVTGDGHAPYGVRTTPAGSVRIEDTTFTGDFPEAAIGGDRWTGERVRIVATRGDGAHLGVGSRLRNSLLPAAADGVVVRGSDVRVEDNLIVGGPGRSAVRVSATDVPGGRVVISGNTLAGGRHTLHEDASGLPEVWITGNRFERDAGQGPLRVSPRAVLVDNTFVDGGPLPGR